MIKLKDLLKLEDIQLPVEVGDTILMGKFKNKKVVIKSIETNEKGDVLINGRPALKFRIIKKGVDEDVKSFNRKDNDGGEYRKYTPEEDSDIEQPYRPKKKLKKNKDIKEYGGMTFKPINIRKLKKKFKDGKSKELIKGQNVDEVGLKRRKIKKRKVVRPSQKTRLMRQGRRYYLGKQKAEKELSKSGLPGQVVSKKMGRQRMFFVSYKKPKNFWGTGRVLNKESGNIKLKDLILEYVPNVIKFKDEDGNTRQIAYDTAIEYGKYPPTGYERGEHPAYKQAIQMKPSKQDKSDDDSKKITKKIMTPPSTPEKDPDIKSDMPSDNVFGVERENPKFVFDKPRPDDNPVKPDGVPDSVDWDSMDGNARMKYLKSVTDKKVAHDRRHLYHRQRSRKAFLQRRKVAHDMVNSFLDARGDNIFQDVKGEPAIDHEGNKVYPISDKHLFQTFGMHTNNHPEWVKYVNSLGEEEDLYVSDLLGREFSKRYPVEW